MDFLKKTIQELATELRFRMTAIEEAQKSSTDSPSTSSLSVEFATFKSFVVESLGSLQRQVELLAQDVDRQEMRSRRKMLLVHGVKEAKDEDVVEATVQFATKCLKLSHFTQSDINRSHRLGRAGGDKPRPILVTFSDMSVRDELWFAKTKLKGTGITLSEFLTKPRHDLFMAARERYGVTKCWTREGSVFVVRQDGSRKQIASLADLEAPRPAAASGAPVMAGTSAAGGPAPAPAQEKTKKRAATKK